MKLLKFLYLYVFFIVLHETKALEKVIVSSNTTSITFNTCF